ncbi:YceI family protein [Marinobacter hydrocarbonoclasticus]|nr:YceI family protein [Marinobacter nauticus]
MRFTLPLAFTLFASLTSATWANTGYTVDPEHSALTFATVKLSYVIEPAAIPKLTGHITANGAVQVRAKLANIETGIPIRNQRLNELFFRSERFPDIEITGHLPRAVTQLSAGVINT